MSSSFSHLVDRLAWWSKVVLLVVATGCVLVACGSSVDIDSSAVASLESDDVELLYAGGNLVNESGLTGEPVAAVGGSSISVYERAAGAEVTGVAPGSPALDFALGDYQSFHQTYAAAIQGDSASIEAISEGPKRVALDLERDLAAIARDKALGVTGLTHTRFANPLKIEMLDDSLMLLDCVEEHTGSDFYRHSRFTLHEVRLERDGDRWSVEKFSPAVQQDALSDHDYGCVPGVHHQAALDAMPEILDLLDRFWSDPSRTYEQLRQRMSAVGGQRQLDEFAAFSDSGLYLDGQSRYSIRVRGSVESSDAPLIAVQVCTESPDGLVARWSDTGEIALGDSGFEIAPGSVVLREFLLTVDVTGPGEASVDISRLWMDKIGDQSCDE